MFQLPFKSGILRRFRRGRRGIAALEFALISPLLVVLLLGSTEVTHLVWASGRLNSATSAVGNVLTQERTLNKDSFAEILASVPVMMRPYANDTLKFQVVSAVACYQPGDNKTPIYVVSWSQEWKSRDNSPGYKGGKGAYASAQRLSATDMSHLLSGMSLPEGDSVIIVRGEYVYSGTETRIEGGVKLLSGAVSRPMSKYVTYQPRVTRRLYFSGVEPDPQLTCKTGLLKES